MAIQDDSEVGHFGAEVTEHDGAVIVSLTGELDLSNAENLRETLVRPDVLNAPSVNVDLTQARFLDSCGIGLLVSACKRLRASGAGFSVSCGHSMARRVIEIAGLLDYFEITDVA